MDEPGIPNLDAMTPDELEAVEQTFINLRHIAKYMRHAQERRLEGRIHDAKSYEREADRLVKLLPEWAKW